MERKLQQSEPTDIVSIEGSQTESLLMLPPAKEPETQWQQIGEKVSDFLAELPEYLGQFFENNKQSLLNVVLIVVILVGVRALFAAFDAINDIPIVYSFFELVGIGYITWLFFRYFLKASTRQELSENIQAFQKEIRGRKNANPS